MSNPSKIIHKQSNTSGKIPLLTDLKLGEFAVNTYDGKIYLKTLQDFFDENLQETVTEEKIAEFTSSVHVENTYYVQKNGSDRNNGQSWDSAFATIEHALDVIAEREALTLIKIGPGVYTSKGHIDIPDNTVIQAVHRTVFFRPEPGYEERNVFRIGSGCFLEGIVFEGWRVDDLDNPTEGFAVAFRPGANIRRVPYVHKVAVRTPPYWTTIAPPLDRENGNPLVGRGAGVMLADAAVLDPDSVFPNIMAWGATPVTHNGIGYCAKNGGLINAINAISIWSHKHFYAIDGGQIVLSACSTQFGDYTMVSKGKRDLVRPYSIEDDIELTIENESYQIIDTSTDAIVGDLIAELNDKSFTTNWPQSYLDLTERDSKLFLQALEWVLQSADEQPIMDFSKGFFSFKGERAFEPTAKLKFNPDKCYRDATLISEAVAYDILFGTNYRSINAAKSYYRANANKVVDSQLIDTVLILCEHKTLIGNLLPYELLLKSNSLFDEIIKILTKGIESASDYILTDPTDYDAGYIDGRRLLLANKTFIQDEIDAWIAFQISNNLSPFATDFTYDEEKCRRDVGLIIDALVYDLTYGGNLETYNAAISYFVGGVSQLGNEEKLPTLSTYIYLRTVINFIIKGELLTPTAGNTTVQDISGNGGSLESAGFAQSRIDDIIFIINNDGTPPTLILPDTTWPDLESQSAFETIQENKIEVSEKIVSSVNDTNETLNYDPDKCYRDATLISEAVAYDILFGSNYRSINAAKSYYRANANKVITAQLYGTIEAINKQKALLGRYLTGDSFVKSNELFDEIINILLNGIENASDYVLSDPTGYDDGYFNARRLLGLNKTFIQDEIDAWIAFQVENDISPFTVNFTYNVEKCRRDVGLIIDALVYDLTYGGNLETYNAAISYFVGSVSQLGEEEKLPTIATYNKLKFILSDVLQGILITPTTGNDSIQDNSGIAGSSAAATFANSRIDDIIFTIFNDGTAPTLVVPNTTWPALEYRNSFQSIQSNKLTVSAGVISNTSAIDTDLVYDIDKCYRDANLISEAVAYDILFNSNYRSINAAKSYYRANASKVVDSQLTGTIDALLEQKSLYGSYLSGTSLTRANALFDEIINIITNGVESASVYTLSDPTGYSVGYFNARRLLVLNKTFIQDEIDAWIAFQIANNTSPFTTAFVYDEEKCRRDVGFIIDALRYDLTYGGNLETYNAAISYFVGTVTQLGDTEKLPTIAAYNRLKTVLANVLQGILITPTTGNTTVQNNTGTGGSADAASFAQSRIDDIIFTINRDGLPPIKILPNTDWPAQDFQTSFETIENNKNIIAVNVIKNINITNKTLLGSFIYSWEYMRDLIANLPNMSQKANEIIDKLVNSIINTIIAPEVVAEPSVITAVGHTWTGIMAGVALTKIPPVRNQALIKESIIELENGLVIASGQDDQGSALFIGGMEINADTGELSGPPFDSAVNRIATRAAISRSF